MFSSSLVVRIPPSVISMTDDQFFEFCQFNRDLRIERDRDGEISIMPPAGSETGNREARIIHQLVNWSDQDGSGLAFSSSAGFKLSTGAERSPDASWLTTERWNRLTPEQQQKFAPICPDFVVELRSPSDNLKPLQAKMEEYSQEPGFRLGLLIDRSHRSVYVYRPGQTVTWLENPETVNADPVLPGFTLKLSKVW
ncbi:Uma2 family endonuclease [Myxacorys almedinensis]|uniref:Uma2 family endonuclease n=1 Tax=Myxacorys almedinensis A TaxID=2690445 RepID=A0A8J7YZJ1_9CYAN|nr:Uma2 family endonuclease [Myxacorys almedinensis]NDJ17429.1 Uma2 family endonuclease [Myxacorys almedinensis A]